MTTARRGATAPGRLKRMLGCADGSVAIQFALLALPLTVLAFGLFDVNRATAAKQQLQDALDAATLLAARSTATTDSGLAAIGAPALQANLAGYNISSSSFHANGAAIDSSASISVTPIISNLWLGGDMSVTATSQVVRSINKVEVAMVLDNTGSMASSLGSSTKISALKTAANSLVDTLAAAAARGTDPAAVKFSVVPFSMAVNVGSTYQNASWLSPGMPTSGYGADVFSTAGTNRFTLFSNMGLNWAGCVEARPDPYDTQDTAPSAGNPATLFVPYFAPDEPDANKISNGSGGYYAYYNNWITNDKTNSTNHVTRSQNVSKYNASNIGARASGIGTGDFGPNRECALTPLLRLTTDANTVKTKLNSMIAVGNTNVAQGLIWGWHTLSPNGPFSDGAAYGTTHLDKIVILLTDGDNTNDDGNASSHANNPNDSIYTGLGYIGQGRLKDSGNNVVGVGSSATARRDAIDSRETKTCANMKAQGIIIYSIGVGVSSHAKTVLQTCASGSDHYYDVTDASQLTSVFNAIAGQINNLRISR